MPRTGLPLGIFVTDGQFSNRNKPFSLNYYTWITLSVKPCNECIHRFRFDSDTFYKAIIVRRQWTSSVQLRRHGIWHTAGYSIGQSLTYKIFGWSWFSTLIERAGQWVANMAPVTGMRENICAFLIARLFFTVSMCGVCAEGALSAFKLFEIKKE